MVYLRWNVRLLPIFVAVLLLWGSAGFAQEENSILLRKGEITSRLNNMAMLIRAIDNLNREIVAKQKILQGQGGVGREEDLRGEIRALISRKDDLEASFSQLATDVDSRKEKGDKKTGLDWQQEIKELIGPLLREIRKITAHPREIERLRNKVELYETRLPKIEKAIRNLDTLLAHAKDPVLIDRLREHQRLWRNRLEEVKTSRDIHRRQLDRKLEQRKPLSQSVRDFMALFFKSRGRNLILAFLSFVGTIAFFFYLHGKIRKISPIHQDDRSVYTRFFDVVYYVFTVITAMLSVFAVLYIFGDWLLLSIAAIFLIGIGWASKQAIPLVWVQIRLLLNLGPVREGELVIYQGLPYVVERLNLYTTLENRMLDGGVQRIPIKDLLSMRSRVIAEDEPWFPSQRRDWVVLKNGTHGRVVAQTPQAVKIRLLGGAEITLNTPDYLEASPLNLSGGYRLWIGFGLDYAVIDQITDRIPRVYEREMHSRLRNRGFGDCLKAVAVQFKSPGPSSLEIEIQADFTGAAGRHYDILQRVIPGICVEIANENTWEVPLRQVRVHLTPSGGARCVGEVG